MLCCLIDAEKSTLLKKNSVDANNHTQTSLFSPVMISSDIGGKKKKIINIV